jgi:putative membrane protein
MKLIQISKTVILFSTLFLSVSAFAGAPDSQSGSILSTVVALDQNEVLAGIQATYKNPSSDVNDFAKMMIDDHGKNMSEALELANKIGATTINPNPQDLHTKGSAELVKLAAKSGDDYNKAYVDAMVAGHEAALKMIDTNLLKNAKNSDLKSFMTDTRAAVAHHLDEAKKLQAKMKG